MNATKYTLQTPLNQRCHNDTECKVAVAALTSPLNCTYLTDFMLECYDRQYAKHRQGAHRIPDWRERASLT